MSRNKRLGRLNALLVATSITILGLAPAAWAPGRYKTLYRFTGGADGGLNPVRMNKTGCRAIS
jgi:hypothetical protein